MVSRLAKLDDLGVQLNDAVLDDLGAGTLLGDCNQVEVEEGVLLALVEDEEALGRAHEAAIDAVVEEAHG